MNFSFSPETEAASRSILGSLASHARDRSSVGSTRSSGTQSQAGSGVAFLRIPPRVTTHLASTPKGGADVLKLTVRRISRRLGVSQNDSTVP